MTDNKKSLFSEDFNISNIDKKNDFYVNVKDFGAVGNGIKDDTNAFIDACNSGSMVYTPNGTYLISNSVDTKGRIMSNDNAYTTGMIVKGMKYKDGSGNVVTFPKFRKYEVSQSISTDTYFPSHYALNSLTSLSNSTNGSDSDGNYYSILASLDATTNTILVTENVTYLTKIRMKGTIQNAIQIDFFRGAGSDVYDSTILAYVFTSTDSAYTFNSENRVCDAVLSFTIPTSGVSPITGMQLVFKTFAGRNLKVYGARTINQSTLPKNQVKNISGLPYKGISLQHIQNNTDWAGNRGALNFSNLYSELVFMRDNFNIPAVRLFMALDSGMNFDGSNVFTGFNSNLFNNVEKVFSILNYLNIKIIPVIFTPVRTAGADVVDMNRLAMTDVNVQNGYANALKQFISRFDHYENIVGYDLINEPHWMLAKNRSETISYTIMQANNLVEALCTAVRTVSKKPIILSFADGFESVSGLMSLNQSLYDIVDYHSYERLMGQYQYALQKPIIIGELGADLTLLFNVSGNFNTINQTIVDRLYNLTQRASCAFIWEQYLLTAPNTLTSNTNLINEMSRL